MHTLDFLSAVMVPDLHHYVWTLADRRSVWSKDPAALMEAAMAAADQSDVYIGLGGTLTAGDPQSRAKTGQIAGIAGVWADVDVLGDGHVGKQYPPSFDDALALAMDPDPSIVVHSGGGWQVYWLFREPWLFDDAAERDEASALLRRWQKLILYRAREKGWVVDATHDLSRVLRVPGTQNRKRPVLRPVSVQRESASRYNSSELIEYLDTMGIADTPPALATAGAIQVQINGQGAISAETITALCENDDQFRRLWYRDRPDLASQSEYDLGLATLLMRGGMADQQITDILVAHRRKKYGDSKQKPLDYYRRTLAKAHQSAERSPLKAALASLPASAAPSAKPADPEQPSQPQRPALSAEQRQAALDKLSDALGVRLLRVVRSTGEEPTYRLILEDGAEAFVPSTRALTDMAWLRVKLAGLTQQLFPRMKAAKWEEVCALLLACSQPEIEGETLQDRAKRYLTQYLGSVSVYIDYAEASTTQQWYAPHVQTGKVWVHAETICNWLATANRERIKPDELRQLLATIGCESGSRRPRARNGAHIRFWALPTEWFPPDYYRPGAGGVQSQEMVQ